ncbi:hypothetical protein [Methanosarcina horonobensis]|nr:hypothetical protein [Methanosarcina horonobensis]
MEFGGNQVTRLTVYLLSIKRILRDSLGTLLLKGWKQLDKEKNYACR